MNDDPGFARVKIRRACAALESRACPPPHRRAAAHLARAREALEVVTEAVLARASRPHRWRLCVDPAALTAAPREVGLRALAALLMAVAGRPIAPDSRRWSGCSIGMAAGTLGGGVTLHGCRIAPAARGAAAICATGTLLITAGKTPENRQIRAGPRRAEACASARCCGADD